MAPTDTSPQAQASSSGPPAPSSQAEQTASEDAVRQFRCSPAGSAWQRQNFVSTLHVLMLPPAALGQEAARKLLLATKPFGMSAASLPRLVGAYLHDVMAGMALRRSYMPRFFAQQATPGARSDARQPMTLPLMVEFEAALAPCDPLVRSLFVEELRCMAPPAARTVAASA